MVVFDCNLELISEFNQMKLRNLSKNLQEDFQAHRFKYLKEEFARKMAIIDFN